MSWVGTNESGGGRPGEDSSDLTAEEITSVLDEASASACAEVEEVAVLATRLREVDG